MRKTLAFPAVFLTMLAAASIVMTGCTDRPQVSVKDVEGVQKVDQLIYKYRKAKSESPDQLTILLEAKQPETFHGLITRPIENSKVQMHLTALRPLRKDTYAECLLADRLQVFEAKVGEHVTLKGRLSEFSSDRIKLVDCRILANHSR